MTPGSNNWGFYSKRTKEKTMEDEERGNENEI
jgi:hypothetical protein